MSLPSGVAQLAECLKGLARWLIAPLIVTDWPGGSVARWRRTQASGDNALGVIQNTVYETGVCAVTPNWCAVLSCGINNETYLQYGFTFTEIHSE